MSTATWWRELSPQEERVVHLIAAGCDTEEICEVMGLSGNTIKTKIRNIRALTGAGSMVEIPALVEAREKE